MPTTTDTVFIACFLCANKRWAKPRTAVWFARIVVHVVLLVFAAHDLCRHERIVRRFWAPVGAVTTRGSQFAML